MTIPERDTAWRDTKLGLDTHTYTDFIASEERHLKLRLQAKQIGDITLLAEIDQSYEWLLWGNPAAVQARILEQSDSMTELE